MADTKKTARTLIKAQLRFMSLVIGIIQREEEENKRKTDIEPTSSMENKQRTKTLILIKICFSVFVCYVQQMDEGLTMGEG